MLEEIVCILHIHIIQTKRRATNNKYKEYMINKNNKEHIFPFVSLGKKRQMEANVLKENFSQR